MFKKTLNASNETVFAPRVSGKPFAVASSFQTALTGDESSGLTHSCAGLLMRKFEGTLFGHEFQYSMASLLSRCKAMIIAINSIHTDGIVQRLIYL
jgi:hypothetical protein